VTSPADDFRLEPEDEPERAPPETGLATAPLPDPAQLEFWEPPNPPHSDTPLSPVRRIGPAVGFILTALALGVAIPGSPVRQLMDLPLGQFRAPAPQVTPAAGSGLPSSGDVVLLRDQRVEVVLEGAPPGTPVHLLIGGGDGIEVSLPAGVESRSGTGRLELRFSGGAPAVDEPTQLAPVRIRIPAGDVQLLLRAGPRNLAQWGAGTFVFGEGLDVETRSDGVTVRVPPL
jgi:hypothetical protein